MENWANQEGRRCWERELNELFEGETFFVICVRRSFLCENLAFSGDDENFFGDMWGCWGKFFGYCGIEEGWGGLVGHFMKFGGKQELKINFHKIWASNIANHQFVAWFIKYGHCSTTFYYILYYSSIFLTIVPHCTS